MEMTGKATRRTFSILGLSLFVNTLAGYPASALYQRLYEWTGDQTASGFRWLFWLFHSEWTDMILQYLFVGLIPLAVSILPLLLLKSTKAEEKRLPVPEFLGIFVVAMGLGYIGNFIGQTINSIISILNGKDLWDMNPVLEMVMDMSPSMIIYACIIGPFMEEVVFRGLLLRRCRVCGRRAAILYTALMFGFMHGNLSQFFYAVIIGLILGYLAESTGKMRYNIALHMMINTYSTILALIADSLGGEEALLALVIFNILIFTLVIVFVAAGVLLAIFHAGKRWKSLAVPDEKFGVTVFNSFFNLGSILFVIVSIGAMMTFM